MQVKHRFAKWISRRTHCDAIGEINYRPYRCHDLSNTFRHHQHNFCQPKRPSKINEITTCVTQAPIYDCNRRFPTLKIGEFTISSMQYFKKHRFSSTIVWRTLGSIHYLHACKFWCKIQFHQQFKVVSRWSHQSSLKIARFWTIFPQWHRLLITPDHPNTYTSNKTFITCREWFHSFDFFSTLTRPNLQTLPSVPDDCAFFTIKHLQIEVVL